MVRSFFRPLLRLQWKLTFSYTLITTTTLVLLTLVGMIAGSEAAVLAWRQGLVNEGKPSAERG